MKRGSLRVEAKGDRSSWGILARNFGLLKGRLEKRADSEMEKRLLTPEEVSNLIGVPVSTLAQWRYRKHGLPFLRLGRLVRYDLADVESYLQTCRVRVRGQLTRERGEDVRLS